MHRLAGRTAVALLVAGLSAAPTLSAQSAEPTGTDFLALEQGWMDALSAQDTAALQQVLAAEFTIIGAGSTADEPPASRERWLGNAMRFRWPRHTVRLLGVRRLGESAVVQAVLTATYPPRSITPEGGLIAMLVTDTWVERDGRWQVVARHSSVAAKGE